jgi:hypothetical protein
MSELDFDELDKAVNNLMGDVPRVEPPKNDDVKTLNISSTLPDSARPSLDELNSALSQVNGPTSQSTPAPAPASTATPAAEPVSPRATTPPLAQRRGGRFMDVVHPSSDMKNAAKPILTGQRQGVTIQPSGRPLADEALVASDDAPVATPDPTPAFAFPVAADTEPATATTTHEPASEWPDPLDMPGYDAEPDTASPVEETPVAPVAFGTPAPITASDAPVDESDDDDDDLFTIDDDEPEDEPQPLTTPFLADAKVEKRPLGSPVTDEPSDELSHAPVLGVLVDESTETAKVEDQLPANPEEAGPALPPELQSDLMAVETDGDTTTSAEAPTVHEEPAQVETPEVSPEPQATPATEAPAAASAAEPAPVSAPTGPTSIPQQYHEEQSTGDQPSGSIYDTDSYHQPLAHPAKTKSGWLWIIWILLLLIVGGGGAVALYFLGII